MTATKEKIEIDSRIKVTQKFLICLDESNEEDGVYERFDTLEEANRFLKDYDFNKKNLTFKKEFVNFCFSKLGKFKKDFIYPEEYKIEMKKLKGEKKDMLKKDLEKQRQLIDKNIDPLLRDFLYEYEICNHHYVFEAFWDLISVLPKQFLEEMIKFINDRLSESH